MFLLSRVTKIFFWVLNSCKPFQEFMRVVFSNKKISDKRDYDHIAKIHFYTRSSSRSKPLLLAPHLFKCHTFIFCAAEELFFTHTKAVYNRGNFCLSRVTETSWLCVLEMLHKTEFSDVCMFLEFQLKSQLILKFNSSLPALVGHIYGVKLWCWASNCDVGCQDDQK